MLKSDAENRAAIISWVAFALLYAVLDVWTMPKPQRDIWQAGLMALVNGAVLKAPRMGGAGGGGDERLACVVRILTVWLCCCIAANDVQPHAHLGPAPTQSRRVTAHHRPSASHGWSTGADERAVQPRESRSRNITDARTLYLQLQWTGSDWGAASRLSTSTTPFNSIWISTNTLQCNYCTFM